MVRARTVCGDQYKPFPAFSRFTAGPAYRPCPVPRGQDHSAIVYAGVLSAQRKGVICLQSLGPEQTLALCSWFCIQTRGRSSPMVRAPASLAWCGSLPIERNACPASQASPRADSISTHGRLAQAARKRLRAKLRRTARVDCQKWTEIRRVPGHAPRAFRAARDIACHGPVQARYHPGSVLNQPLSSRFSSG